MQNILMQEMKRSIGAYKTRLPQVRWTSVKDENKKLRQDTADLTTDALIHSDHKTPAFLQIIFNVQHPALLP